MINWKIEQVQVYNPSREELCIHIEGGASMQLKPSDSIVLNKCIIQSISTISNDSAKLVRYSNTSKALMESVEYIVLVGCYEKNLYLLCSDGSKNSCMAISMDA